MERHGGLVHKAHPCVASSALILTVTICGRFGTHDVSFLSELCWKELFSEARLYPSPQFGLEL